MHLNQILNNSNLLSSFLRRQQRGLLLSLHSMLLNSSSIAWMIMASWLLLGIRSPVVDATSLRAACPTTSGGLPEDSCSHSGEDGSACRSSPSPSPLPSPFSLKVPWRNHPPQFLLCTAEPSWHCSGGGTYQSNGRKTGLFCMDSELLWLPGMGRLPPTPFTSVSMSILFILMIYTCVTLRYM